MFNDEEKKLVNKLVKIKLSDKKISDSDKYLCDEILDKLKCDRVIIWGR